MSPTKAISIFAAAALIAKVSAHGIVQGIVVDGVFYSGYIPSFSYQNPSPIVAGWTTSGDSGLGFVSDYTSPDIVCHKGATPGSAYVTVAAGDDVELQWTVWSESHRGPVMDYLASCNGDCTTVDKTALLFNKIDEAGLIDGSPAPGTWASDTLIANNNSWTVTIPSDIAPGKYILRHETIALHSAENLDGSQAYPQCVNLEITGAGTNTLPTGTIAQDFYKDTDPGILVNIYYPPLTNYTIPGPALIADAVSASQPSVSASTTETAAPTSAALTGKPAISMTTPSWNSTWINATMSGSAASTTSASPVAASSSISGTWSRSCTSSSSAAPTMTSSSAAEAWPSSSNASSVETSTSTSPVSFTSTFTGRMGKPTKFTCYIDED